MREILFKAKTESGRWIEGDLIHYQSGEVAIIEKPFSKYGYEATEICGRTLVLPDTICQYTGLADKNGNKIWENDIMKYEWDGKTRIEVIKYQAPIFTYDKSFRWSLNKDEVIGNIFDNPELLERN